MLFIAYSTLFSCFGKLDLMCEYHQHRIGQRDPTWVGHVHGPGSWEDLSYVFLDLGKIMVRLFSPSTLCMAQTPNLATL